MPQSARERARAPPRPRPHPRTHLVVLTARAAAHVRVALAAVAAAHAGLGRAAPLAAAAGVRVGGPEAAAAVHGAVVEGLDAGAVQGAALALVGARVVPRREDRGLAAAQGRVPVPPAVVLRGVGGGGGPQLPLVHLPQHVAEAVGGAGAAAGGVPEGGWGGKTGRRNRAAAMHGRGGRLHSQQLLTG